ncbi:MAG: glycosyltransferase family 39 protein, partial [Actinobacteria bacterium]|nr:glycosyltransferase family 39 protein [Actinomycetota bacterium]
MYPIGRPAGRASDRLAGWTLALAGVVPIARYLWIVAHRVAYPYELQWMEGGTVELVNRLIRGRSLYTAPTLRFTPWPYPPFYFLVSSALARVIGVGFLPLRLVSIAASIGVLLVIGVLVHGETDDRAAAVFAAGVYAATFRLAGAWADIGRVDSLWLLLCLGAVLAARRAASWRAGALVGVVFFLASFTKQDGLIVAAPVIVALVVARRRAGIAAAGLLASLVA